MADKIKISELVHKLRKATGMTKEDVSDSELVKQALKLKPELQKRIQSSTPRQSQARGEKEGFWKALGSDVGGMIKSTVQPMYGSAGLGEKGERTSVGSNWSNVKGNTQQDTRPEFSAKEAGLGMLNLPAIADAEHKGDMSGAIGHAVIPAVGLASLARGAMKPGAGGGAMERFQALTDKITAPIQETLNAQGEAIKTTMQGQLSNVAAFKGNPVFQKLISRLQDMEHLPNTKVADVSAAREALESLQSTVNSGKPVSWGDLFELNKQLKAAGATIKDPAVNAALRKLTDTVNSELSTGAKQAGVGKHYDNWQDDYALYRNLRRRYDEALKSQTDVQREVKQGAKSTSRQILGTTVGSTKANKVAKVGGNIIKQGHKAFDELHKQIKARPDITPPAPSMPPGQVIPPQKSLPPGQYRQPQGVHPPAQKALPPITLPPSSLASGVEGAGTFSRTPRPNPVEHPQWPAQMPQTGGGDNTVGSAAGASADTGFYQQAKTKLGPNASVSEVAQEAQRLKMAGTNKQPF